MRNLKKSAKIAHNPTRHYPGKTEAAIVRKIRARTGLTEKEIRKSKELRAEIANAIKRPPYLTRTQLEMASLKRIVKQACKITKLATLHPVTLKIIEELVKNYPKYAGMKIETILRKVHECSTSKTPH